MKRYSKTELAKAYLALSQTDSRAHAIQALAAALIIQHQTYGAAFVVREISRQLFQQGEVLAEVISARALSHQLKTDIKLLLTGLSQAKHLSVTYRQDKKLIGGFIAQLPTQEVDASIASLIRKLSLPVSV